jgi:hypothetical protein
MSARSAWEDFLKIFKFFSECKVCRRPKSLRVIKLRRNSDQNPLEEEPFHFQGRVDEISQGGVKSFLAVRSGKVAWVITLEVLRTSCIQRVFCKCCGGDGVSRSPGIQRNLDHPFVRTCVHRSNRVQKSTIQRFGSV